MLLCRNKKSDGVIHAKKEKGHCASTKHLGVSEMLLSPMSRMPHITPAVRDYTSGHHLILENSLL